MWRWIPLVLLLGCSGSDSSGLPADFSGNYSVSITNSSNGCNYANWKVGESVQNIEVSVGQSGADLTVDVRGLANIYFAVLGIGTLKGTAGGSSASATAVGTNSIKQGLCAYF